jgi:hypothetical protein
MWRTVVGRFDRVASLRRLGLYVISLGLSLVLPRVASAQPQDDAALADDKPRGRTLWHNSVKDPEPEPEPDLEPVMTTDELRRAYPDLELETNPGTTVTVSTSVLYPFQSIALAIGSDVYALPRLRVSAFLSAGFLNAASASWRFSVYGEGGIGLVVARWQSQTIAHLPVVAARFRRQDPTDGPIARAVVPSSHALELEGGVLSGYYALYRCTANCDSEASVRTRETAGKQLVIPYAGLRYVYYRLARSKQAPFRSASRFQVAAHVLVAPFDPPDPQLFRVLWEDHPSHDPVGGRIVFRLPAFKCAILGPCFGLDFTAGYLPSPSDFLGSVSVSVY